MDPERSQAPNRRRTGPAVWFATLGFFAVLGLVIVAFAVWSLASGPSKVDVLTQRGLLAEGEQVRAVADLSAEGDMSEGCVVTEGRVTSWQGAEVVDTVSLAGSSLTVRGHEVTVHGGGQSVVCRFRDTDRAEAFADDVARETLRTRPRT